MASTLNLRSFLQTELQALSAEARRKHPEVKEAAERVLVVLRGIPSSSSAADVSQSLRQSDEIVRPFALACQSAAAGGSGGRMCSIAMQGLQQLVAARAVSGRSIAEVLRTLQLASAMGVEVQVKVLQMVLPLVTQYAEHVAGEELVQALHVCLALQRSRDAVVANTAAAMLRQAVEEVFDRVARDADEQTDGVRQQHEHDAQFVLQDLCLLAADHEPVLLQRAAGVDKRLVLELLEALLANHAAVIAAHGKMTQVLRERLAPFLVGFFADAGPFAEAVRCTRMLVLFVRHMHAAMAAECEVFLGILARLLGGSPQGPAYCRVLAAEAVRQLAESGRLALRLFARYDGREGADDCHVVCDLVAAVARAAAEVPAEADAAVSETCGVRTPLGALLDKAEAPAVPAAYVAGQAQQALWALAAALAGGVLPWRTRHIDAEEVFDESLGAATDDVSAAAAVLAAQTWPALLAALDGALGGRLDDGMFSRAVAAAGQLACVWGALGLQDARDAAIELLCSAARATDGAAVGGRQVQCVREAVRCAKYLAAVMRQAWAGVLRTVQAVDEALHVPDGGAALEDVRGEVERMRALVARAGPPAYLWAMRALAGLGCAAAGVPAPDGAQLPTGEPLAAGELFSTAELRALAVAADGGGRALVADAEAWRLVSQHLLLLATHAQTPSAARTQACSALADVVLAGMEQVGQAEASGGSPSDAFGDLVACGAAQRSMLQPLAQLMQGPAEARRVGLDTLQRVLQAAGHSVGAAWPVVFDVVDPAVAEDAGLARVAFGCVQLVCSDHLADLPPECVRRCIGVLQGFGGQRADLNVALTAVGQAWALCDFFHARPADDAGLPGAPLASAMLERQDAAALVEQWRTEPLAPGGGRTHAVLWALLLHALAALARDRRHAVRLSATQTLFRALDAHGAGFPPWLCDAALWAVILPLAQHALDSRAGVLLGAAPDAADAGADEAMRRVAEQSGVVAEDPGRLARRQWDESVATAMLGLAAAWRALGGSVGRREDAWARVWGLVARLA
ncbi:Endocytosis and vacuole integrity protein, partial [Coemansia interrupta]